MPIIALFNCITQNFFCSVCFLFNLLSSGRNFFFNFCLCHVKVGWSSSHSHRAPPTVDKLLPQPQSSSHSHWAPPTVTEPLPHLKLLSHKMLMLFKEKAEFWTCPHHQTHDLWPLAYFLSCITSSTVIQGSTMSVLLFEGYFVLLLPVLLYLVLLWTASLCSSLPCGVAPESYLCEKRSRFVGVFFWGLFSLCVF